MLEWLFPAPTPLPPPPPLVDDVTMGISLACLAATMAAVGINLQRLGSQRNMPVVSLFGVVLASSCGAADLASFQFAPQSLLAPFAALGLLVNLFLAPIHGERISAVDLLCTVFVISGVATCLSSATTELPPRTADKLAELATRPPFLCWSAVVATCIVASAVRAKVGPARSLLTAISWAICAGVVGGCTILSAKVLTECLKAGAPMMWLVAVGGATGVFAISQVTTLNAAVTRYSSLLIVPIFTASSLVTNGSGGGIFFEEFAVFDATQRAAYLKGVSLLLTGIGLIAFKAGRSMNVQKTD